MTTENERLMEHEYDGIREYDNPTPGWWHAIFLSTIVFAFFYATFWHGNEGLTVQDAWQARQVAEYKRIFGSIGELKPDRETIQRMMADPQMLAVAKGTFQGNCAACHARDGGGINGVNLTDDFYKNIKVLPDLFNTITKGANAGAMPSWENKLGQNERIIVAAYVATLRGTHPAAPKAPEGVEIPPWPAPPAGAPAPGGGK